MRGRLIAVLVVATLGGMIGGSFATLAAQQQQRKKADALYVHDKAGHEVHLGDIIKVDKFSAPIKVNGWTSVPRGGTTSGYEYQIEACPSCKWVDTFPPKRARAETLLDEFLDLFGPTVAAQDDNGDGRSIVWGSD